MKEKEEEKGKKKKEADYLKMVCSKGSWDILAYIGQEGDARYKDLTPFASTNTLNTRLKQFLSENLIKHHFMKTEVRKEWYELTEKGNEVLQCLRKLINLMEGEENCQITNDEIISDNMQ